MEPYILFFKTVVSTVLSLFSAAAVLLASAAGLDESPRPDARRAAVRIAPAALIAPAAAEDVHALAARLSHADPAERAAAACALERLGDAARPAIPALVAALRDASVIPAEVCDEDNPWRARRADAYETTPGERAAAALAAIGSAALGPLQRAIRAPQWVARKNAAWALGAIGDQRASGAVAAALGDDEAPVRRNAAWALGALDAGDAVDALTRALQDADRQVREMAAWALGAIGDARAAAPLTAALSDADAGVRGKAAWALGAIGSAAAVDGLIALLGNEADAKVRSRAAWALGAIGDGRAAAALSAALKDPSAEVRRTAAWALGAIGD